MMVDVHGSVSIPTGSVRRIVFASLAFLVFSSLRIHILPILIFDPPGFYLIAKHRSSWANHVRITAPSPPSSLPHQVLQADPQLHPHASSSITVYGRHGEAVQLCVRLVVSHTLPVPDRLHRALRVCYVCCGAVNASELERLKKRFMKLDRCLLLAGPSALCPGNDSLAR